MLRSRGGRESSIDDGPQESGWCVVICDDHEGVWVAFGLLLLCVSIPSESRSILA